MDINQDIHVQESEVNYIVERIMKLSEKNIDLLWHNSKWIDSKHGKNKSLPDWRIKKIKTDEKFARESFINLITESNSSVMQSISLLINNLINLEKKK